MYKLESRLLGEISITEICRWHHPYGRKWRGTKDPFDEGERGEKKRWLKTQHSKNEDHGIRTHHFMENRWRNNGNTERLYFLGLQNHWRGWMQPWNSKTLAPWKKSYDKLRQCSKKQRYHFAAKGLYSQSYGYSSGHMDVSWTIKKAECQKTDALELWCWRRVLRVPWTAKRSNQSILKEISPEYSLERWMLKLKLQYLATSCEELIH